MTVDYAETGLDVTIDWEHDPYYDTPPEEDYGEYEDFPEDFDGLFDEQEEPASRLDRSALNPKQLEAVDTLSGPLMVVAGPGSGKTRVLTDRLINLLEHNTDPRSILAITFTKKAANEVKERVAAKASHGRTRGMWLRTFHGFCLGVVKAHTEFLGLPADPVIWDTNDTKKMIRNICKELGVEYSADMHNQIFSAKDLCESSVDEMFTTLADAEALQVWGSYEKVKARNGAMDFSDIQLLAVKVLENPDLQALWRKKFRHISVDEFQDTNPVQQHLVKLIGTGADSIMVVGDGDQSIYGFRGAVPLVMDLFAANFPDTTVIVLEDNYRSNPDILHVVRGIISKNEAKYRSPLTANRNTAGGGPRINTYSDANAEITGVVRQIISLHNKGVSYDEIAVIGSLNSLLAPFEAELASRGVSYRISGKTKLLDRKIVQDVIAGLRTITRPNDTTAFLRFGGLFKGVGDKSLADVAEQALKRGVSIYQELTEVVEKAEAKAAKSRKAAPAKYVAMRKILTTMDTMRGALLRETDVEGAGTAWVETLDVLRRLFVDYGLCTSDNLEEMQSFINLATQYEMRTDGVTMSAGQTVRDPLLGVGIIKSVAGDTVVATFADQQALAEPEGSLFREAAGDGTVLRATKEGSAWLFSVDGRESKLVSFLDWLVLYAEAGEAHGAVTLTTVHSSKGQEFDHVFVIGLEDNLFPRGQNSVDVGSGYPKEGDAEERRLMFVACSRARTDLVLSWTRYRVVWGRGIVNLPSEYLYNVQEIAESGAVEVPGANSLPELPFYGGGGSW